MAGERTLASARVKIIADARGLPEDVKRQTEAGLADAGQQGGSAFGRRMKSAMTDAAGEAGRTAGRKAVENLNAQLRTLGVAQVNIDADPKAALRAIKKTEVELRRLSGKSATVEVKVQTNEARRSLKSFTKQFVGEGLSAGSKFGAGFAQNIAGVSFQGPVGLAILASLVGIVVAAAPLVASALGGAIVGAIGLSFAVLGVVLVAQNKKVVAAFTGAWEPFFARIRKASGAFIEPTIQAIKILGAALKKVNVDSIFKSSAKFVVPLANGLAEMLVKLGGAFDKVTAAAGPIIDVFSKGLGKIGESLARGLTSLIPRIPQLADAFQKLVNIVLYLIDAFFGIINAMAIVYKAVQTTANAINTAWSAVVNWFSGTIVPSILHAVALLVTAWNAIVTAVQVAWNAVRSAISAVVNWFVGTVWASLQTAIGQIVTGWNALVGAVTTAWNAVKNAIAVVVGWFVSYVWPVLRAAIQGIVAEWVVIYTVVSTVWNNIYQVISFVVRTIIAVLTTLVGWVATALVNSWHQLQAVVSAVWGFIVQKIQQAWLGVQIIFNAIVQAVSGPLSAVFNFFRNLINTVWTFIWSHIQQMWLGMKIIFNAIVQTVSGPLSAVFNVFRSLISTVWSAIQSVINTVWGVIRGVFVAVIAFVGGALSAAFNSFRSLMNSVWENIKTIISNAWTFIKGIFGSLQKAIEAIPGIFSKAAGAIGKAWDGIKSIVEKPIVWVVSNVINPLVRGYNKIAKVFSAPTLSEITIGTGGGNNAAPRGLAEGGLATAGLAGGGQIPGHASSTDNRWSWLKDRKGKVLGQVGLATGEFVVNARDTAKALPLLKWINSGMRGNITRRLGRPLTDLPGDGSEGWGFAGGGLVGFIKDVMGAVANPANLIKAPVEAAIKQIPGAAAVTKLVGGMGHALLDGLLKKVASLFSASGGGGGPIGGGGFPAALAWARTQVGKPYIWASSGPNGYDCSGFQSAIINHLQGRPLYSRRFSTGDAGGPFLAGLTRNKKSPYEIGVFHGSPGHTAGTLNGVNVESSGSVGVRVGGGARGAHSSMFTMHYGLGKGGFVRNYDLGGVWPSGTLGANTSGHDEYVTSGDSQTRLIELIAELVQVARQQSTEIGNVLGAILQGTLPATRVASRQMGRRALA